LKQIDDLLVESIGKGAFPGAAYCYGNESGFTIGTVGKHSIIKNSPKVSEDTWWDLASVTKVMSTTMGAICAVRDGLFDLDDLVTNVLPESKLKGATIRNLLLHDCGIKAYDTVTSLHDSSEAKMRILTSTPTARPGEKTVYSCLGFINLMTIIERASGMNFGAYVGTQFHEPLGIEAMYCPPPHLIPKCAPTEETPSWRRNLAKERGEEWTIGEYVQGSVHDPIAYVLGGLSGNAGLFAPIDGVAKYLQSLAANHEIFGGLLAQFIKKQGAGSRALGFDTKSPTGSSAGTKFGPNSFGHTGYTGTCVWVDPDRKIYGALLTNRVHPKDADMQITAIRPRFFDLAFEAATS